MPASYVRGRARARARGLRKTVISQPGLRKEPKPPSRRPTGPSPTVGGPGFPRPTAPGPPAGNLAAVDAKIEDQAEFVLWWDEKVRPNQGRRWDEPLNGALS